MTAALFLTAAVLVGVPSWHDGDSGRLNGQTVRLRGVEAGELPGSPKCRRNRREPSCGPTMRRWAIPARDRAQTVTARGVRCEQVDTDRYRRAVVVCLTPDGRDVAAILIREGLAVAVPHYGGAVYLDEEEAARRQRLGVWSALANAEREQ